jgi:glucose-1-phosphate thymidylyltransferase
VTIREPVYVEDGVSIRDSVVGPNVTIETGSVMTDSAIADSILGRDVRVTGATVRESVVGDAQVIEGCEVVRSVADGGEVAPAR